MYKICANSFGFAALKRRLAMVVGGILRHISSQTSGSALVDLLVKTSHSKSCKLRNLRVLRISAVIDLPQVSPLLSQNKHWECWGAVVLEVSLKGCPHDLPLNWLETIDHWGNRPEDLPSAHRHEMGVKLCRCLANYQKFAISNFRTASILLVPCLYHCTQYYCTWYWLAILYSIILLSNFMRFFPLNQDESMQQQAEPESHRIWQIAPALCW